MARPLRKPENRGAYPLTMPETAENRRVFAPGCFPPASPAIAVRAGKQKATPKDRCNALIYLRKFGAGEGIRTLDPNLGNVEIYVRSASLLPHIIRKNSELDNFIYALSRPSCP